MTGYNIWNHEAAPNQTRVSNDLARKTHSRGPAAPGDRLACRLVSSRGQQSQGEGKELCTVWTPQAYGLPPGAVPQSFWRVNTAQHFFPRTPAVCESTTSLLVKQLVTEADPIFTPGERAKGQASPQAA